MNHLAIVSCDVHFVNGGVCAPLNCSIDLAHQDGHDFFFLHILQIQLVWSVGIRAHIQRLLSEGGPIFFSQLMRGERIDGPSLPRYQNADDGPTLNAGLEEALSCFFFFFQNSRDKNPITFFLFDLILYIPSTIFQL